MYRKLIYAIFCSILFQINIQAQIVYIDNSGKEQSFDNKVFESTKQADIKLKAVPVENVKLLPGLFQQRYELNKKYVMSLDNDKLLQNFYFEAGLEKGNIMLQRDEQGIDDFYWGWESPMNQLRGHFLGHWLSAAAYLYAETKDEEIKAKADKIVAELALCQKANGGQWVGSIPEKYMDFIASGHHIWSPQYTLHKTLMGLYDMYTKTGSKQALEVMENFADWFHTWTDKLIAENNAAAIYQGETSGMLEIWANLYGVTKEQKYLDLMERYGNPNIFQELQQGKEALSNNHANASIPWSHGSARIYEVTGNDYWKNVTLAFWNDAVNERESFCTGGQNCGEHWIPKGELAHFVGENNQEHCTVYNMIRTADYLYRWTGDPKYADYIEKNIYNGILAQQNPNTGMVAYFLPMGAGYTKGGEKGWGDPTKDFFCCHGTLVQAHTRYNELIYFESNDGISVSQYIPSELKWKKNNTNVTITQNFKAYEWNNDYNISRWDMVFTVKSDKPIDFMLDLRLPAWLKEKAVIKVNGIPETVSMINGTHSIKRTWNNDEITIEFPTELSLEPLPDTKNRYAFMEGPIVLAGLSDTDIPLHGDVKNPSSILSREYEQQYRVARWKQSHYNTINQDHNIRFVPLYEIADERYTIYFPISK